MRYTTILQKSNVVPPILVEFPIGLLYHDDIGYEIVSQLEIIS